MEKLTEKGNGFSGRPERKRLLPWIGVVVVAFLAAWMFWRPVADSASGLLREHGLIVATPDAPVQAGRDNRPVRPDVKQAERLAKLVQEAEQGSPEVQNRLGWMYNNGANGAPKDDTQAVYWFRKAAERGFAKAQCNLGLCYAKGEGVPKDERVAAEWYRKAADQDFAQAQFLLGGAYFFGEGLLQDSEQALAWVAKAEQQGYPLAKEALPMLRQAVAMTEARRDAAQRGDASAQFDLGRMYEQGHGLPKDDEQALLWYRKAAGQGHLRARIGVKRLERRLGGQAGALERER